MSFIEVLLLIIVMQLSNIFIILIATKQFKNPIKAIKNEIKTSKEDKKAELLSIQYQESLDNIDRYDGTGIGQKDITRSL